MRVLRWEKPPPPANPNARGSQASQWDEIAAELRYMAGVWGVIYEGPGPRVAGLVSAIRRGGSHCWSPGGTFEAQQVGQSSGVVTIYARFVGDEAEASS